MSIVTLTTDWGFCSFYAGAVKGTLLRLIPGVTIVDISHQIPCFNILHASFVLSNSYPNFPEGTIHIIGVNTEASLDSPHIVVLHKGQYFIGADNGIFSLILQQSALDAIELEIMQDSNIFTFSTRDVFAKAASLIAQGLPLNQMGKPYPNVKERFPFMPVAYSSQIIGKIIFIDNYQNLFVNVDKAFFTKVARGRDFVITLRIKDQKITHISNAYGDVPEGEIVGLFGSSGYLEIAINKGMAASLLGLQLNDSISIDFI